MVTSGNLFAALDELVSKAKTAREEFEGSDDFDQLLKDLGEVGDLAWSIVNSTSPIRESLTDLGKLAG